MKTPVALFASALSFFLCCTAGAYGFSPPPLETVANSSDLSSWRKSVETELRSDILPFWIANDVDHERGGFYGEISAQMTVRKSAVRGALLTSRILWTYSNAYRRYKDPELLTMAKWAYDDLIKNFSDPINGGFYWSINAGGKPKLKDKQIYGQAFAIYSLSEYFLATHDQTALDKAIATFHLLEQHARDPKFGAYWEACTQEWVHDGHSRRGVMENLGRKSQNTNLHVLEAFSNLLRAWPDPEIKSSQRALIEIMADKILDQKTHHLILFLDDDYKPTTNTISFGHDIEFSWLLTEAADLQGDPVLSERVKAVALSVAKAVLEQGVVADGSIVYEASPTEITNPARDWWPEAEAAIGFYNAYQLSGDTKYRDAALRVWNFIENSLVDRRYGEWYRSISKSGRASTDPKVSMWKCPYHNGRACLQLIERFDETAKSPR